MSPAGTFSAPRQIGVYANCDLQAGLQRQAVVFNALLAEPLPHAVTLAAALVSEPCPGEPQIHDSPPLLPLSCHPGC